MEDHDTALSSPVPFIRIWLCGPLHIEWTDPRTGQTSVLREQDVRSTTDATQVLSLLKMLLCQPGRQAHRDWILEQFWPEHTQSAAVHRFHNIISAFRKVLCPPDGISLLPPITGKKDSSSHYTLPAYPRLWVDRDAVLWNVEQAVRMQRFGDDAFPFWQRAYELLKRGPFLADEPYAEWAKARREPLEGCNRQCVHALWRLLVERHGDAGKAEALLLLRTYWQQHKTDEDALRPLMELLGEQERYQEAEEYYTQLLHALAELDEEDGRSPREPDERTRDVRDYLHTKQIQRQSRDTIETYSPYSISQQDAPFLQGTKGAIIDVTRELVGNTMDQLRRQILQQILNTVGASLLVPTDGLLNSLEQTGIAQSGTSSWYLYEHLLSLSWEHYYTKSSHSLTPIIDDCLRSLTDGAQETHNKRTRLLCQFYQLSGVVARDTMNITRALSDGKKAIELAFAVDDVELIAASLFRRAKTYMKQQHYSKAIQDLEASLIYAQRSRDPLKGYVHQAIAEAYTLLATPRDQHLQSKSLTLLDSVEDILSTGSLEDDGSFVKVNTSGLSMDRARVLAHFQRPEEARQMLVVARHHLGTEVTRWQSRLLIVDAEISLAEKKVQECCESLLQALKIVRATNSRSNEMCIHSVYEQLNAFAPDQSSVFQLGEHLHIS